VRHERQWEAAIEVEHPDEEAVRFFKGLSWGIIISAAIWTPLALVATIAIG
jgi:hypothetical protein